MALRKGRQKVHAHKTNSKEKNSLNGDVYIYIQSKRLGVGVYCVCIALVISTVRPSKVRMLFSITHCADHFRFNTIRFQQICVMCL